MATRSGRRRRSGGQPVGGRQPAPAMRPARPGAGTGGLVPAPVSGTRAFATAVAGIGPLLAGELAGRPGAVVGDSGFDGRSDVVLLELPVPAGLDPSGLLLAEDLFVEVGRTLRADGDEARWIAGRIWRPARVRQALAAWSGSRPVPEALTFRVVVRVLQERSFLRTDLRRELTTAIRRDQPGWRPADPARLEVWVTEYRPGRFLAGLRLSDAALRQHDGRRVERPGALRPTVAAAMVRLAGPPPPDGPAGRFAGPTDPAGPTDLLDPCCGSGTILAEAVRAGWHPRGADIDPAAVGVARRNVEGVPVQAADARDLDLPAGSVAACVSNLPFGQRFAVPGDPDVWLRRVLAEMARVTRGGGRVVVLTPRLPRQVLPSGLVLVERHPLRLLGTRTTIWACERRP